MLLNRKNGSFSAQAAETVVIKKPSAELSENNKFFGTGSAHAGENKPA